MSDHRPPEPVPRTELIAILRRIIEERVTVSYTRESSCFLATISSRTLADGLLDAGCQVVRQPLHRG